MPRHAMTEYTEFEDEAVTQETNREQDGQTLAEYVLIVMLVALVCIGAVTLLGIPVKGFYTAFNAGF